MLFDVFLFISTHMSLVLFSPGSAEADIGWGGILNANLIASCAENKDTKNWISFLQVTIDNVWDLFFPDTVYILNTMKGMTKQLSHNLPC